VDVGAGVLQGGEGLHDLVQLGAGARHRRPPATGSRSRHGGRYTRSAERAQGRKVYQIVIKVRAGPGVTPTRKTPTWQLSSLPSRPLCWRPTPALRSPFLAKPLSSTYPTTSMGLPATVGTNSSTKAPWSSAWASS